MSGHSKWSTIKNKKEKTDKERAKIFTKIGREISVAIKNGGADPSNNGRLRDVIAKAKALNVPNANIERIIKKAAEEGNKNNFIDISYEGYGPEGVAVLVRTLTDNKNRTAANIRHYFDKFGGNLGSNGCVSYIFTRKGVIYVKVSKKNEDNLMEFCVNSSVSDFEVDEDIAKIILEPDNFLSFVEQLKEKKYEILSAEIEEVPSNFVEIKNEDNRKKMEKMIENFEEDDDVQEVWTNFKDF